MTPSGLVPSLAATPSFAVTYYGSVWVTVHLFAGLALGNAVPAPYWALALIVVASHVFLDVIPHWDYTRTSHPVRYGAADFSASVLTLLVAFLAFDASPALLLLGVLAAAPDFDVLYNAARGRRGDYWWPSHWASFPHGSCAPLPGILTQATVVAVSGLTLALA